MKINRLAGVDEVGRGCLFGPVVAAAVVANPRDLRQWRRLGITDSKKLSPQRRRELVPAIKDLALAWHISFAGVEEIESLNIRGAALLAIKRAVLGLTLAPDWCLVDGRDPIPGLPYSQTALIQGDRRSPAVGAASILAKVWRDELLIRLERRFPGYGLAAHKGYGTARHRQAIQTLGLTPLHRRRFCRGLSD
ncbi:MAG: ribonuclease HII [Cyanobacteriota bacterium]|nr:ribonuclease HII [Cyanobacteriota bacterium]